MQQNTLNHKFIKYDDNYKDPQLKGLREKLEGSMKEIKAGTDMKIGGKRGSTNGRAKIASVLGLRQSPFSERIVDFFFSGETFSEELFMDWVEILLGKGNYHHKARFIFYIYDVRSSKSLTESDIEALLLQIVTENKFKFKPASLEILTQALFTQFGEFLSDGTMTEQEFIEFSEGYPEILDNLTIGNLSNNNWKAGLSYTSSKDTIAAFLGKNISLDRRQMPWSRRLYYKWQLEGSKYIILFLWIVVMAVMFGSEFSKYNTQLNYDLSGYAIPVAKSAGATIRLNSHLLLLPVCKQLSTAIRGFFYNASFLRYFTKKTDFSRHHGPTWLWDKHISFHKRLATAMIIAVPVHVIAHLINVIKMANASDELIMNPHYNWCCGEGSYFDRFPYLTESPGVARLLFLSVPGWTGWLLLVILTCITYTALAKNRSKNFERFFYTHYTMVYFYALLLAHGSTQLVAFPRFWIWSLVFLTLFLLNTILRLRSMKKVAIVSAKVDYQTQWLALTLQKPENWSGRTGSYALLNVPEISRTQFHPFTLSSTPDSEHLGFHIKCAGDWTKNLQNLLKRGEDGRGYPEVVVEGPYASAAEHVFEYDVCLLFCAGIGVTPYASILEHIKTRQQRRKSEAFPPQHKQGTPDKPAPNIYFYWTCRDQFSFSWFGGLFGEMLKVKPQDAIQPFTNLSHPAFPTDRFVPNLFMTGALPQGDVSNTILQMALDSVYQKTNIDLVTGIADSGQTRFGRPNIEAVFEEMIDTYPGKEIGVFFCGPQAMGSSIHTYALNKSGKRGTIFRYFKEVF